MKLKEISYRETISNNYNNCAVEMKAELEEGDDEIIVYRKLQESVKEKLQTWKDTPAIERINEEKRKIELEIAKLDSKYSLLKEKVRKIQKLIED